MGQSPRIGLAPPGRFRLGLFCYNVENANALTRVPERWTASFPDIVAALRMAEDAGFDFALPIARWRGYGERNLRGKCFETLTLAAALAGSTRSITLFSTVHVPLVHPLLAAKALATIDHASGGRAGLNITAGWNQDEFDMFGHVQEPHDTRYDQAREWFSLYSRVIAGEGPFDHDGRWYRGKGIVGAPASLQRPRPPTLSAGFSPAGRDFAASACDHLFTFLTTMEQARIDLDDIAARAARAERRIGVLTTCYVVCRPTRAEAEDYHRRYAEDMADDELVQGTFDIKQRHAANYGASGRGDYQRRFDRARLAGGNGTYPLVGTPADVAEQLVAIARAGFAGATVSFVNFLRELPFFAAEVMPILARAGLREEAMETA